MDPMLPFLAVVAVIKTGTKIRDKIWTSLSCPSRKEREQWQQNREAAMRRTKEKAEQERQQHD